MVFVRTRRFDCLVSFLSVYDISQITVDVETSFISDVILSEFLIARFCPLLV